MDFEPGSAVRDATARRRRARFALATGLACGLAMASATLTADDTEVFFGQIDPGVNARPNVLFVLDTSGSMKAFDGGDTTRLERMKQAMYKLIDNTVNVNIGLMRFNGSNSGGPVLFPVTPIDEELCADADCGLVRVTGRVEEDTDDVVESLLGNAVELGAERLTVGQDSTSIGQSVGLRFPLIDVPQGATIVEARLELTAIDDAFDSPSLSVSVEASDDAAPFSSALGDVSGRLYGPSAAWIPGSWSADLAYETPDLSDIVEPVIGRSGWCGGNALVLKIEGTGSRDVVSSTLSLDNAPRLTLVYDSSSVPPGGGCTGHTELASVKAKTDDAEQELRRNGMTLGSSDLELPYEKRQQVVGIRFADLNVPQGATITAAHLEFQIDEYKSGDVTLSIVGEATDDARTFRSNRGDITARTPTAASVAWIDPPAARVGETIRTPDLSAIVQEIVDRGGWSAGNALAFGLVRQSGDGRRIVESYDGDASAAPKLYLEYGASAGAGTTGTKITARERLKQVVADLKPDGGTPLVDAYYEAATYYRGGPVDYGRVRGYPGQRQNRVSHPASYTGGLLVRDARCTDTNPDSRYCASERIDGAPVYVSPIASSCQTNNIVLLTDGVATSNTAADKIRAMAGLDSCEVDSGHERCGRSLATWLNEHDARAALHGTQSVSTYTVGFNLNDNSNAQRVLDDIAVRGGGEFHTADTADELADVFQSVLREVQSIDTSFVAPGAAVSQFDRLTHGDQLYFAVFKPMQSPTWAGNLKRYRVGRAADDGKTLVLDIDGKPAVNAATGYFAEDSQSWWSAAPDGNAVGKGGAAEALVFDGTGVTPTRRAFTFTGDMSTLPATGADLTLAEHALDKSNTAITLDMLGLAGVLGTATELAAQRDALLDWARGIDVLDEDEDGLSDDWRQHIGDPMHSRPVIVGYEGGTAPGSTVFMATNEGFLHAIDSELGKELYTFIPQELLPNLSGFMDNSNSIAHPYGLDGSATLWTDDLDGDLLVDPGESAYLYVGMRRGGTHYYAIDVSDRLAPRLTWSIKGGPSGTPGFEELGQSWSRMIPTRIAFEGSERDVLIFAGGYDENQDHDYAAPASARTPDSVGRGIFVVDARTGELLWSGLGALDGDQYFARMNYSIPSDIRIVDIDLDGLVDLLYVGDMGGQLWRFDLIKGHTGGELMSGGVIAELSGVGTEHERRFYYPPDVALIGAGGERFLSLAIGSGWRAHPLDRIVDERFYMIRDDDLYRTPAGYGKEDPLAPDGYAPLTEADLLDITDELDPLTGGRGWLLRLEAPGEKVLGSSITVNNQIVFTSFRPEVTIGDCSTAVGGGSVYVVDVLGGSPVLDLDEDGVLRKNDRERDLTHGGIPPDPMALITKHGPIVLVGPEQPVEPDFGNLTRRSYWVELGAED